MAEQDWDIISGVGRTALAVAAVRAIETHRADRLIDDPHAEVLVRAADQGMAFPTTPEALAAIPDDERGWAERIDHYVGVRSRVFDDFLLAAARSGLRQFVVLAAGLDARPYRLDWPGGTVVFELDQPKVLQFKRETLADVELPCGYRPIGVDLREDWPAALIGAGFDTAEPAAWLAEGLLPYLPAEAERRLLATITELSAPSSRVAVEEFGDTARIRDDPKIAEYGRKQGMDLDELLHAGGVPVTEVLDELGWRAEAEPSEDAATRLGRDPGRAVGPMLDISRFVTAVKPG
ncbi:SAM-dependent methyltransferase [Saccharopolyspora sp. TS4A08]|uniref:S-adenosyl-L-methionine-dependent methyltransferase n=1 Tax=Saccharopolyspora ipomoeae TaxID=3042027 RepID=A0ABT6PUZ4_9PSEU|nr:SAM-dependent methyltransferase [Saccharopolyspora sp. TS4A08]MDI2031825.1 SAM-dependent methyltransferase [Saccharopolyspora sp. TS4A08]